MDLPERNGTRVQPGDDVADSADVESLLRTFEDRAAREGEALPAYADANASEQTAYLDRLDSLFDRLEGLIMGMATDPHAAFRALSNELQEIFRSKYVEFLMLNQKGLEYSYITAPDWMLDITHRLTGITAVRGMIIPLFEGSSFQEFIDAARPRELITPEDRLRSFRDFVPPDTKRNRWLRDHIAPLLMKAFAYDYVFQVPLIVHHRLFGYFSFLQKGRMDRRRRMDIVMLAEKIAHLLSLRHSMEQRRKRSASLPHGILVLEQVGRDGFRVIEANPAFCRLLRMDPGFLPGNDFASLGLPGSHQIRSLLDDVHASGTPDVRDLSLFEVDIHLRLTASRSEGSELVLVVEDISETVRSIRQDRLTGVLNRPALMELLEYEMAKAARSHARLAVFFLDLNGFKDINDRFGHAAGDQLLSDTARAVRQTLRSTDIVGRYGGDEFIVVAPIREGRDAREIARKIQRACQAARHPETDDHNGNDRGNTPPAVSIGRAIYDQGRAETIESLLGRSDRRMYACKRAWKTRCEADRLTGAGTPAPWS